MRYLYIFQICKFYWELQVHLQSSANFRPEVACACWTCKFRQLPMTLVRRALWAYQYRLCTFCYMGSLLFRGYHTNYYKQHYQDIAAGMERCLPPLNWKLSMSLELYCCNYKIFRHFLYHVFTERNMYYWRH